MPPQGRQGLAGVSPITSTKKGVLRDANQALLASLRRTHVEGLSTTLLFSESKPCHVWVCLKIGHPLDLYSKGQDSEEL